MKVISKEEALRNSTTSANPGKPFSYGVATPFAFAPPAAAAAAAAAATPALDEQYVEYYNNDEKVEIDGTKVMALWSFEGERDSDLNFQEGDIITVLRRYENGWWEGEVNGRIGDFPSNYVELCADEDEDDDDVPSSSSSSAASSSFDSGRSASPGPSRAVYEDPNREEVRARPLPMKEGFLQKKGHRRRNWKVRYFVLERGLITYYANPGEKIPKGTIPLHKSTLVKLAPEMKRSNCFTISLAVKPFVFYLAAPTGEEMIQWMELIISAKPT